MSANPPLVKHLESQLLTNHTCRRRRGEISYPAEYCNEMADFDIWHHLFLFSYCNNLTMHRFEAAPSLVLDLGCGTGYWALEAAKQWPECAIIGYDNLDIQPRLSSFPHLSSISNRIRWVHGNMLDGLDFPDCHFDFVRIAGLGLAVPEDEWQSLFEEIYRILKPGGVIEVIEDDLLFPCPSSQLRLPSLTAISSQSLPSLERLSALPHQSSYTPSIYRTPSSARFSVPKSRISTVTTESTTSLYSPASTATAPDTEHPQDHTRLKLSWDTMLASRFLSAQVIAVLPFYLSSASFENIASLPQLTVPLPPNSGPASAGLRSVRSAGSIRSGVRIPSMVLDFGPSFALPSRSTGGDSYPTRSAFPSRSQTVGPGWSTMHLAKAFNTVRGCKEAIWKEYKKAYSHEAKYLLSRTAPHEDLSFQSHRQIARRAFEVDWINWEHDMQDRMNMRRNVAVNTAWQIPLEDPDHPDHRPWRKDLDPGPDNSGHLVTLYNPDDVCRSLRAFTARKPLSS